MEVKRKANVGDIIEITKGSESLLGGKLHYKVGSRWEVEEVEGREGFVSLKGDQLPNSRLIHPNFYVVIENDPTI